MSLFKQKKNQVKKVNRLLITVAVLGRAGPIRFIVEENELVSQVIETTLKLYAHERRLPVLGSNPKDFALYCPSRNMIEALDPRETIGSLGFRDFVMYKKPNQENKSAIHVHAGVVENLARKESTVWGNWFNNVKIIVSSH